MRAETLAYLAIEQVVVVQFPTNGARQAAAHTFPYVGQTGKTVYVATGQGKFSSELGNTAGVAWRIANMCYFTKSHYEVGVWGGVVSR